MKIKKFLSIALAFALSISGAIVKAETTDELTLTGANLATSSTATYADDKITIAAGQKAIFDVSIDEKITYDVTLPDVDVATLATYKYQVLLSYDSKDVIKLYNDKVKSQPGWITFQANTTALTFENLGTTDMTLTSVKLSKKVFGANESKIVLPALNYDFSASTVSTAAQGGYETNGETQSFVKTTNYGRMNFANNVRLGFDVNLESDGVYYVLASVRQAARAAKYIVELDGAEVLVNTITAKEDNRTYTDCSKYSYLYNLGKITLHAGENKLVPRIQDYAQVNGYMLVKPSSIAQVGASNNMLYAPAATSWLYGAWGLNSPKFVFYGQVSSSYQTMSELGWIFNVQNADDYKLNIVGNYNGSSTMKVAIDGVAQDVSITGTGVSGQTLATIDVNLTEGVHIINTRANVALTFNGINLAYTSATSAFTTTVKASAFNLYKGQGDMAATYGGYYDTTPSKMDATYFIKDYSPCEFRHPGGNADIDAAIMSVDEWMEYTVCVPAEGYYDLSASVAADSGKNASFNIIANGVSNSAIYESGVDWNTFTDIVFDKVYLKDGANTIIVKNTFKGVDYFASFTLTYAYSAPVEVLAADGSVATTIAKDNTYKLSIHNQDEGISALFATFDENGKLLGVDITPVTFAETVGDTFTVPSTATSAKLIVINASTQAPIFNATSFVVE